MKRIEESIVVDSSIQLNFQRQNMTLESIFREFIDNSYDSYNNPVNRSKLNDIGTDKCYVRITIDESKIIIEDEAYGMDHEGFKRALRLSKKSDNYHDKSLGQFGMGLKYAAISLGNEYTIESSALGSSEKYKATITRELLENNSKTVTNEIDENYDRSAHFTKITITRLIRPVTNNQLNSLINDLGKIYNKYIEKSDLEITFPPNRKVAYIEPELWSNEDGSLHQKDFEDTFEFNNKVYTYYGWIGILRVGDTKGSGFAGLSLHHKDRIIQTNYRNEELMGRANSFPYQRLVGDVNLDDFPVDFNKSAFSWNNGLEAAFIESLKKNEEFSYMKKTAATLRKREGKNTPKKEEIVNINQKQEKLFGKLAASRKTVVPLEQSSDSLPVIVRDENAVPLSLSYEGIDYTFFIEYSEESDATKKWLKVNVISEEKHEYSIKINNNFKVFGKNKKSDREVLQNLILIIALTQLSTIRSGFKDSYKFVAKMNEIIGFLEI